MIEKLHCNVLPQVSAPVFSLPWQSSGLIDTPSQSRMKQSQAIYGMSLRPPAGSGDFI